MSISTVLVTGANRGIGLGIVNVLAKREGVQKIFAGYYKNVDHSDLQTLQKENDKVMMVEIDVSHDASIKNALREVQTRLGENEGLNLLINNAAILERDGANVQNSDRDVCWRHFNVNTMGPIMVTSTFLPLLNKAHSFGQPAIVLNISSTNGSIKLGSGEPFIADDGKFKNIAYGMSKAAINHYTKALSKEESNIIVVAMCPGWVKTQMGSSKATTTVEDCAQSIVERVEKLKKKDSGTFMNVNGEHIPY